VDNVAVVHVRHSAKNLLQDVSNLDFRVWHPRVQVASRAQFHHDNELLRVVSLEGFVRFDDTPVIEGLEDLYLVFELIDLFGSARNELQVDNFQGKVKGCVARCPGRRRWPSLVRRGGALDAVAARGPLQHVKRRLRRRHMQQARKKKKRRAIPSN